MDCLLFPHSGVLMCNCCLTATLRRHIPQIQNQSNHLNKNVVITHHNVLTVDIVAIFIFQFGRHRQTRLNYPIMLPQKVKSCCLILMFWKNTQFTRHLEKVLTSCLTLLVLSIEMWSNWWFRIAVSIFAAVEPLCFCYLYVLCLCISLRFNLEFQGLVRFSNKSHWVRVRKRLYFKNVYLKMHDFLPTVMPGKCHSVFPQIQFFFCYKDIWIFLS